MTAAWSSRDRGIALRSGRIGMSSGLGTPRVGARKKMTTEESNEETELCSNMN